ncbi:MAG: hypothetical protein VX951_12005 [Planctomycetota bacterium]|nr:hypothetical protein [Planctomycetota bacterium]
MKPHLVRSSVVAAGVCVAWLGLLLVGGETAGEVTVTLLEPWFTLCGEITPKAWQTRGNLPLFVMWMAGGIAVYSAVAGFTTAALWVGVEKRRQTTVL